MINPHEQDLLNEFDSLLQQNLAHDEREYIVYLRKRLLDSQAFYQSEIASLTSELEALRSDVSAQGDDDFYQWADEEAS